MNSHAFLAACKAFSEATRSNITIQHYSVSFTVKYVMTTNTNVERSYIEINGLVGDEAERMFHALFSEAGND